MQEKIVELINRAIAVVHHRDADVDTSDGTFATTDTDAMIHLEAAIQDLTGFEASELFSSHNTPMIINGVLNDLAHK